MKTIWDELNTKSVTLYEQGRFPEAAKVAQEAVKAAEETFGTRHPNVATSLNNLAGLYEAQSKYAKAEPPIQAGTGN